MKKNGVEEVCEPIEDVESGRGFERKGLKKLLGLAHAKVIDYVYVLDLDRLGRHVAETPYLMYNLKEEGVIVSDINEEYNFNDPIDYVIVTIKCYRGHSESLKIGERTQRGKNEKFVQGKWVGPVPFGYRKNAEGKLEKLFELEPIISDIFETYKTNCEVKETTWIVNGKYLEKIGSISTGQVRIILKNPVYIGQPRYGKTQINAQNLVMVSPDLYMEVQKTIEAKASKHKHKEQGKSRSILDNFAIEYGLDHVMRVTKLLKPICPRCSSIMVGNGSKPYESLRLPNFMCTNTKCGYQRTIPSVDELHHFRKKVLSCPKCRAVEDLDKTMALDGSIEHTCRRCGTSFLFKAEKELEAEPENISGDISNPKSENKSESLHTISVKGKICSIDLLGSPIKDYPRIRKKRHTKSTCNSKKDSRELHDGQKENPTLENFFQVVA
jgi:DNA invertase Pin-like site-specific DNA recombinase